MVLSITAAIIPLFVLVGLALTAGADVIALAMRDVAATAMLHSFTGFFSNMGAFLFFAAATVCLFARVLFRHRLDQRALSFLGWSGALSIFLWFDDFFLFHERLAPEFGIHEKVVMAALALWVAVFVQRFWSQIMTAGNPWLAVSLALLSLSAGSDVILSRMSVGMEPWALFVEDGFKWLGVCAWAGFFFLYGLACGERGHEA